MKTFLQRIVLVACRAFHIVDSLIVLHIQLSGSSVLFYFTFTPTLFIRQMRSFCRVDVLGTCPVK